MRSEGWLVRSPAVGLTGVTHREERAAASRLKCGAASTARGRLPYPPEGVPLDPCLQQLCLLRVGVGVCVCLWMSMRVWSFGCAY